MNWSSNIIWLHCLFIIITEWFKIFYGLDDDYTWISFS